MQLSVKDIAGFFNVSEKTIYRWISERHLPANKVNHQYRFNRAELLEWATETKTCVSPKILHEPETGPLTNLVDALQTGGIFYGIDGKNKESVLRAIVKIMRLPEEVDREFLLQVLLAREALGTTGIGEGIAIPHVRSPIVLHLPKPIVTLCFLKRPIDFGAVDGQPVTTLFILISPTVRSHLHLLSRLGFILRDQALRTALARQAASEELIEALRQAESTLPLTAKHGRD